MAKEPYLPLFVGDFLAATVFWKGEERALYLLLLAIQWASGPLPSDISQLAEATGYDRKHFARLWQRVGTKFHQTSAGLINDRLEEIRAKARDVSAKRTASGAKGGEAKRRQFAKANGGDLLKQTGKQNGASLLKQNEEALYSHPIQSNPNEEEEAYQGEEVGRCQ
jgi:uncharacterized protein YdaU (DUF1376 family)